MFICLFAYILFLHNRADIFANLGKYYAQNDNYSTAQEYYEKSYLLGNKNSEFRENYVNLLINSPLTIRAQERLVNIAEDNINDSASESAKYFLYNLKREIHNKYRDNYIQQATYNQKIVHWGKLPITYSIKRTKDVPHEITNAVNDAFDTWERSSSVRIRFEKVNVNADIVVSFTNNKIDNAEVGRKYIIAYTFPEISQNKLLRMDLTLNTINIDGNPFTPNQIYNTALHEIFHALGFMGHSFNKNDIMYMTRDNSPLTDDARLELSDADKITLELLYKIKPDITNADDLKYEYIPYPVIGDNADINYAKADEAKNYIRKAPRVPTGYIDLAQTYINEKNYTLAISTLKKALILSKNSETKYLVLYNLAVANFLDDNFELVHLYINKAKEIKDEEELHFLSAETYIKEKNINSAINEYEYLIRLKPDNIEYTVSLANIYISKRNYIKARKVLKNYIKRNPQEKNNPRFAPCKILIF